MTTNILGLYSGHDAHFCLLQDGVITRHFALDRFTRHKHSVGFDEDILDLMLKDAGITWADIDAVACGGCRWDALKSPSGLFDKLVVARDAFLSLTSGHNSPAMTSQYPSIAPRVASCNVIHEGKNLLVYQLDHHLAHAAQAHYTSPWPHTLAFSFDGGGDGAFMLSARGVSNQMGLLEYNDGKVYPFRPSIGNVWTLLIRDLYKLPGGSTDGEGKVMGHAAYGTPRPEFVLAIEEMMRAGYGRREVIDKHFVQFKQSLDFSDFHSQALKDFSASVQAATEKIYLEVIDRRVAAEGLAAADAKICLSGGVAYNCCANGEVFLKYPHTFVSNCPNDGGLAIGACLLVWHHYMGNPFNGVAQFNPFKGVGYEECDDDLVVDQVVDDLLAGRIVAWFNGRAENGARALGHRSILADPRLADVKERINTQVKRREWFRPFAPSVLEGYSDWAAQAVPPSWYMSFAIPVTDQCAAELPGVTHVDKTCRPQVVTKESNPLYWAIIDSFRQATGVPMILNTSFNIQEPIVETEEQARATFARSSMDVLYINGVRYAR